MDKFPNTTAWAEQALASRGPGLALIAADGETFGHHCRAGEHFLHNVLLRDAPALGFQITSLTQYLANHPPQTEIELREMTSWSCMHGVARWVTGCECTPGDGRWKGALRRALDNLSGEIDLVYTAEARAASATLRAWPLRDAYIAVVLGQMDGPAFLAAQGLGSLPAPLADRLLKLLQAEFYRQRMYASCAFYFEELTRVEPRYAIANAARAVTLVKEATGEDLSRGFHRDLSVAVSSRVNATAADLYDAIMAAAQANSLTQ
jgi:hypothetical protein